MPNDRRRSDTPGAITRPVIAIALLNVAVITIATGLTGPWTAVAIVGTIVGLVSAACITAVLIARRR